MWTTPLAIFLFLYISYVSGIFDDRCITPPLECPNINISFWLYTRANEKSPHELKISDSNTITSAPWVKGAAVKILIHGYTGHREFSPSVEIRPAYMECCDYNIISVDYNKIALEPCYLQAARNTELVGMCTAQLIDELIQTHGFELPHFHIIGFSLGGHAAGYIANFIKSGKIERISALDPALPLFATRGKNDKVDPDDALFVDVLHTNALKKGKLEKSGHVDFYANGGVDQPGCMPTKEQTKSGCDHSRAPAYYAESIISEKGFYAIKCFSWITYFIGLCDFVNTGEEILFGEYTPKNVSGIYYFRTNSKPPFAQGSRNKAGYINNTENVIKK